jgi:hypothetical protein
LKTKYILKKTTEELLDKRLKSCKRNTHELSDSIKTPNLQIISIEKGEEMQAKGIHNILNKIITENFPNLKKVVLSSTGSLQDTKKT